MGDTGFEHSPLALSKTPISQDARAESGALRTRQAVQDKDLAGLIEAWPKLPEHIKSAISILLEGQKQKG